MNENDADFNRSEPKQAESSPAFDQASFDEPQLRPDYKIPILAGLLSGFPGLGNLYNGLYMRGVTFFLIIASLIRLIQEQELFGFALAFFWLFNMIDAYRQAVLINYGLAQDLGLRDAPKRPNAAQGGLAAGFILFSIGLVALLERHLRFDIDWLFELWPVALMIIGAWIVVSGFKQRSSDSETTELDI